MYLIQKKKKFTETVTLNPLLNSPYPKISSELFYREGILLNVLYLNKLTETVSIPRYPVHEPEP